MRSSPPGPLGGGLLRYRSRMMKKYRVQLIGKSGRATDEVEIEADRPEEAAAIATGGPLSSYRGRSRARPLRAKVYWRSGASLTLRRFYADA